MTAFWTDPTALMWTDPSALIWTATAPWTESWFGGVGSFDFDSGTYSLRGSGEGVVGTLDGFCFASQPATGDIEFRAYVSSQSSSDAYAIAGLMARNSFSLSAACAMIGVSPQNGLTFSYRTDDGAAAEMTLGQSISAPVWLKLVVSQTSVAGYSSLDGINFRLVGETTMSFSTDYFVGFAASSNSTSLNTATYTNLQYLTNVVQRSADLISWLRADSGVAYDSGTNQVSLWNDQSANGYNGSQSVSVNQPTLVTNAVNGLPAIEFTPGSDGQFLQFPDGFDFTAGVSLFVVVNPTSMAADASMLDFRNFSGSSSDQFGLCELNSTSGAIFYAYDGSTGSSGSFSGALTASEFQLLEAIYDGVSSVSVYTNGTLQGTQGSLETLANVTRNNNYVGQSGDGGNYFTGQIAEILIFSTNLDDTAREALESYLLAKYSL